MIVPDSTQSNPALNVRPEKVELGWVFTLNGFLSLQLASVFVIVMSGLAFVYTNREKVEFGYCGIIKPDLPPNGFLPKKVRESTFCWQYLQPTLLFLQS